MFLKTNNLYRYSDTTIIMNNKTEKVGFGLSVASILGSIYAYTQDEHLGLFIGLWASAIMVGSKRIQDWIKD